MKTSPIVGLSGIISSKFNIDTTTNGKTDKDYKKLNKSVRSAISAFDGKNVDYNVDTSVNDNKTDNVATIRNIGKLWADTWKGKNARYDAQTATNGQNTPSSSILSGIVPSKLRGYIKYTPGTVDYSETDALTNGATDIGIVYIALGDWDAPVRITTKDKNLFDKNDEKIIAYGEQELTTQT